jgi:hypothetical protein
VLLIGDVPQGNNHGMPTSYDNTWHSGPGEPYYPSVYYFSCVTKSGSSYDWFGDLYIGRFCVDNNLDNGLLELQNIVDKTIYYESEATFGGWRDETGVLIQLNPEDHYYNHPYFSFMEDLVPSYFTVDTLDCPSSNGEVYSALNDGVMTFTYFGHGGPNSWSTGTMITTENLEANLENDNKAPVVLAVSCYTAQFDTTIDCMAESLTTYSDTKGFTGYVGACRTVGYNTGTIIYDAPTRFQELIPYTIFHDLSHITG